MGSPSFSANQMMAGVGPDQRLAEVGKGEHRADGLAVLFRKPDDVGVEDLLQPGGEVVDLGVGQRHKAPVLLPGRVIDALEAGHLFIKVAHVYLAHGEASALLDLFGHAKQFGGQILPASTELVQIHDVGHQVHRLVEAGGLDEFRIVARVVGHHDHRRAVPSVHQQADLLVGGEVGRATDAGHPTLPRPVAGGLQQCLCCLPVWQYLE